MAAQATANKTSQPGQAEALPGQKTSLAKRRLFPKSICSRLQPSLRPLAIPHFKLGICKIRLEDFSGARRHFLAEVRRSPESGEAHFHLGYCEGRLGNPAAALENFEKAQSLGLGGPGIRFNLGFSSLLAGQCLRAVEEFSRAINRGESLQLALLYRGFAYAELARPYALRHLDDMRAHRKTGASNAFHSHFYCGMALKSVQALRGGEAGPLSPEMREKVARLAVFICDNAAGGDSRRAEREREIEAARIALL